MLLFLFRDHNNIHELPSVLLRCNKRRLCALVSDRVPDGKWQIGRLVVVNTRSFFSICSADAFRIVPMSDAANDLLDALLATNSSVTRWPAKLRQALDNKRLMFKCFEASDQVDVIPTRICDGDQAIRQLGDVLGFPVISKTPRGNCGRFCRKLTSKDHLVREAATLSAAGYCIFQRYIAGDVIGVHCVYDRGRLCSFFANRASSPDLLSPFHYKIAFRHLELQGMLEAIGRAGHVDGLIEVEFMCEHVTNKLHLMEINARASGALWFALASDYSFLDALDSPQAAAAERTPPHGERIAQCSIVMYASMTPLIPLLVICSSAGVVLITCFS